MNKEYINQEQMSKLVGLIIDKGINHSFITLAGNVSKLDELTVQQYNGFLAILEQLDNKEVIDYVE